MLRPCLLRPMLILVWKQGRGNERVKQRPYIGEYDAGVRPCEMPQRRYSQQPQHSFQAVLHRHHLFHGEIGQWAFSEAVFVERAGLIDDHLARL